MPATKVDAVGAASVEQARHAVVEIAGEHRVGGHLGVTPEDERVVCHRFACVDRAYPGWEWTVVLARVPRARVSTVSEVALLPGTEALIAPPWVPWADRIAPGDLGDADVLPYREDDPLLDESYEQTGGADIAAGDPAFDDVDRLLLEELGLGRPRVLNRAGREDAAQRWYRDRAGPEAPAARAATASCDTCGYLVRITGSLRQLFGVCANAWSPDDGSVVSLDHGCGAHSETGLDEPAAQSPPQPLIDQFREVLDVTPEPVADPEGDQDPDER
jgi:hypothetical protein